MRKTKPVLESFYSRSRTLCVSPHCVINQELTGYCCCCTCNNLARQERTEPSYNPSSVAIGVIDIPLLVVSVSPFFVSRAVWGIGSGLYSLTFGKPIEEPYFDPLLFLVECLEAKVWYLHICLFKGGLVLLCGVIPLRIAVYIVKGTVDKISVLIHGAPWANTAVTSSTSGIIQEDFSRELHQLPVTW